MWPFLWWLGFSEWRNLFGNYLASLSFRNETHTTAIPYRCKWLPLFHCRQKGRCWVGIICIDTESKRNGHFSVLVPEWQKIESTLRNFRNPFHSGEIKCCLIWKITSWTAFTENYLLRNDQTKMMTRLIIREQIQIDSFTDLKLPPSSSPHSNLSCDFESSSDMLPIVPAHCAHCEPPVDLEMKSSAQSRLETLERRLIINQQLILKYRRYERDTLTQWQWAWSDRW